MQEQPKLTDEQQARIDATLKRIRGGLKAFVLEPAPEPAHRFVAEVP